MVFLLTESSMLYHHLLNPLCAFVSFVLLEREPKLPARCVPLALVPTHYGSGGPANYQRLITGPYPFLLVYQQTTWQTVLWCAAILAMNLLYAWIVWRLVDRKRKMRLRFSEAEYESLLVLAEPFLAFCYSRGIPAFAQAANFSQNVRGFRRMVALPSSSMHRRLWPDATADGVGQLTVQHCLAEGQGAAVVTACHGQLPVHALWG